MVEGVPAGIGTVGPAVGPVAAEGPFPVKVEAVGAGVGIDPVQDDPDPPAVGRPAEGLKVGLRAQHGVRGLVVPGVVAVGGEALADGVQVDNGGAQGGNIVHFLGNAPEIAAEKVVVQHPALIVGPPVHLFVPVLVDGVGLELAPEVRVPPLTEPVRKYLIDHRALGPLRGVEVLGDTADLPQVSGLHIGVVSLLEQPEGAVGVRDAERVEIESPL